MVETNNIDKDETIQILDDIAILEPGKNAQIAAKKNQLKIFINKAGKR